jgi:hypothetical protein
MKNLMFLMLFLLGGGLIQAQVVVNDVNINELEHVQYVELLGVQRLLSNKIVVNVDYGQPRRIFREPRIKDGRGRNMKFNSMIDALNFMAMNGWEYVNNHQIHTDDTDEFHFLLRRVENFEPKPDFDNTDED